MKYSSSTGKFLREHITKGKLIASTLTSTISSLGLFGSLALFKELEKAIDHDDTNSLNILKSLIDQINVKIKTQLPDGVNPEIPEKPKDSSLDFIWIWIGLPCLVASCFCSCFCFSLIKKIIKLGIPDTQNMEQQIEIIEIPADG